MKGMDSDLTMETLARVTSLPKSARDSMVRASGAAKDIEAEQRLSIATKDNLGCPRE